MSVGNLGTQLIDGLTSGYSQNSVLIHTDEGHVKPFLELDDARFYIRLTPENVFGDGGFCYVTKGYDKELKQFVAIKQLKEEFCSNSPVFRLNSPGFKMLREAEILKSLSHPNVLKGYEFTVAKVNGLYAPVVVTEVVEGIPLDNPVFCEQRKQDQIKSFKEMADALDYVHSKGYVHCDVKPKNFILDSVKNRAVVIDFTESVKIGSTQLENIYCTPGFYNSAILSRDFQDLSGITIDRDKWGYLASVMYIMTGKLPYGEGVNPRNTADRVLEPQNLYKFSTEESLVRKYGAVECRLLDRFFNKFLNGRDFTNFSVKTLANIIEKILNKEMKEETSLI